MAVHQTIHLIACRVRILDLSRPADHRSGRRGCSRGFSGRSERTCGLSPRCLTERPRRCPAFQAPLTNRAHPAGLSERPHNALASPKDRGVGREPSPKDRSSTLKDRECALKTRETTPERAIQAAHMRTIGAGAGFKTPLRSNGEGVRGLSTRLCGLSQRLCGGSCVCVGDQGGAEKNTFHGKARACCGEHTGRKTGRPSTESRDKDCVASTSTSV